MASEINTINQLLPIPNIVSKTRAIRDWMDSVIDRMDHYKAGHNSYVMEAMTLLELALWKAKLDEKEVNCEESATKKLKIEVEDDARLKKRVTCGADTVIKHVVPFLRLE